MATGKSTSYEASAGSYVGNFGNCYIYARIELTETYNESANTSDVSWTLKMKKMFASGSGIGNVTGTVTVAGKTKSINTYITIGNDWTYVASDNITGIAHDDDGTKSVNVSISNLTTDSYAKGYDIYITMAAKSWSLTDIPRGTKVRIGDKWYYVLIGNGSAWKKQKVKIGTGTAWKDY